MTREMVKMLFPVTKNSDEVVGVIEKYRMKFGLNTSMRLAQFLAQVREEVGPECKVIRVSLNYKEEAVLKMWPNRISISDAEKYARDEDTPKANQEVIANLAYSGRLGNGAADSDNDGDMDANDDGYKYRGAGCLQITGKSNFAEVQKRCMAKTGAEANPAAKLPAIIAPNTTYPNVMKSNVTTAPTIPFTEITLHLSNLLFILPNIAHAIIGMIVFIISCSFFFNFINSCIFF